MKTLIVYGSKYGFTKQVVERLETKLSFPVTVVDLNSERFPNIAEFEMIIIGSPIYMGKIQPEVRRFCDENLALLRAKNVGLFILGAFKEKSQEQLKLAFPEELSEHAITTGYFGYELDYQKMKFFDKMITKLVAKNLEGLSWINEESIRQFARKINETI